MIPALSKAVPAPDTHFFYRDLPVQTGAVAEIFENKAAFRKVPDDWAVVMLDVAGSTAAVARGMHHDVNLAATGGIVAMMNAVRARDPELAVPYFFGGDGVTFLLPDDMLEEALDVLDRYRLHVAKTLSLTLKVGAHSVAGVRAEGHEIRVAKLAVNETLVLPVVVGTGVKYAERLIKAAMSDLDEEAVESIRAIDLEGMECRWDVIPPPRKNQRVACLIVSCADEKWQRRVYAGVARAIEDTFGAYELRHPISGKRLKLDLAISKIRRELSVKLKSYTVGRLLRDWLVTVSAPLYFRFSEGGRRYFRQVVDMSHTLMLDGTFNVVLSGTDAQILRMARYLDAEEEAGRLRYGLHVTDASLMSCYVVSRDRDHAHFVDGTEGGFTSAAMVLKPKL